ncbi:hypothetical protein K469DRAFT_558053 [Zopfia rhizophila CBS 207.26]|uniref:Uncharacterized protein n=1 Tax=Zopfia rhizophila CBS 207.26 TaxID=1314779 RepID=A0A6A6EJP9_9PEZI|nr:hypothetical protein K469DRAFT_558053 [Zopfia rhizophila CBS 207.26]
MLSFHSAKRPREEDSDSEDDRYTKKSRFWQTQYQHGQHNYPSPSNLPLRPSLTHSPSPPSQVPNLEAMTPAQSEHSEANSPVSLQDDPIVFSSPHDDIDMEMDDDDFDIIGSQPPDSPLVPFSLRPAKLNAQLFAEPASNTGRIPTPIHGTFYAPRGPVRGGGIAGLEYPGSGMAGSLGMGRVGMTDNYLGVPEVPILHPPVMRKQAQVDADRGRRMPSPISEDEDIPDTPTAFTQSQLSRLSVTTTSSSDATNVGMEEEKAGNVVPPPGVVTTPSRGRKRSGAFTGKGRFSMGYREDCDKCRARIPGHYSHFLPA